MDVLCGERNNKVFEVAIYDVKHKRFGCFVRFIGV